MGREGHQEVVGETLDARKAAGWSVLAGLARLAALASSSGRPWPFDALLAVATALVLPAIAVLHARHAAVRSSGAMLGTISGTAALVVGLVAVSEPSLRPAALLTLGVWWWTDGKMWVETDVLPRVFGIATAALGVLAIAAALLPQSPTAYDASHVLLGAWLVALAAALWMRADVPSA